MENKKILYIGNKLADKGYTATAIDILAPRLRMEGFEVIAVSDKKIKAQRMLDMLQTVWKHRKTVSFVLIDTYSTLNFQYAVMVAKLCRQLGIAYIPILHGGNLPNRLIKNRKQCQKLFGGAMVNVAPSQYLMQAFAAEGYTNLVYVPNTIAIEKYTFQKRSTIKPKLLWVRSFSEIYNPILALEILAELTNTGIDATLTMVGPAKDGSYQQCLEKAEKEKLPVHFTGMLSKEEWISLAAHHDIFINTTNFDNTPVSVIEAMALGLPVISTHVGGVPYLVQNREDGILVPPNSPTEFVTAIENLLDTPELVEKLTKAARKKVEQFDWNVVKHQWISLLHQ